MNMNRTKKQLENQKLAQEISSDLTAISLEMHSHNWV